MHLWLKYVYIIIVCLQLRTIMSLVGENSKIKMIIKLITTTTQSCSMYVCMCHHHAYIYYSIHSKVKLKMWIICYQHLLPTCAPHIKIMHILSNTIHFYQHEIKFYVTDRACIELLSCLWTFWHCHPYFFLQLLLLFVFITLWAIKGNVSWYMVTVSLILF